MTVEQNYLEVHPNNVFLTAARCLCLLLEGDVVALADSWGSDVARWFLRSANENLRKLADRSSIWVLLNLPTVYSVCRFSHRFSNPVLFRGRS